MSAIAAVATGRTSAFVPIEPKQVYGAIAAGATDALNLNVVDKCRPT